MSQITEFYFYRLKFINCNLRKFFFYRLIVYSKLNFFLFLFNLYHYLSLLFKDNFFFFNFRFIYRKLNLKKKKASLFLLFRKKKNNTLLNNMNLIYFNKVHIFLKWIRFFFKYTVNRYNRQFQDIKRLFLQNRNRRHSFFVYLYTLTLTRFPIFNRSIKYWKRKKKKFYCFFKSKSITPLSFLSNSIIDYFNIENLGKIQIPFIFKIVKKKFRNKKLLFIRGGRSIASQFRKRKQFKRRKKNRFFTYIKSKNIYKRRLNYRKNKAAFYTKKSYDYNFLLYKIKIRAKLLTNRAKKINIPLLKSLTRRRSLFLKKFKFFFSLSRVYFKFYNYLKQIKYYSIFYSQLYYFYKLRECKKIRFNFIKKLYKKTNNLLDIQKKNWLDFSSYTWNYKPFFSTKLKKYFSTRHLKSFLVKNNYLINDALGHKYYLFIKSKTKGLKRLLSFISYNVTRYSPKPLFKVFRFFFIFRFMYSLVLSKIFIVNLLGFSRWTRIKLLLKGLKEHLKLGNKHSKYNYFLMKSNVLYAFLLSNICFRALKKRCFKIKRKRLSWLFFSQVSNFFFQTFSTNIKFNINFSLNASISKKFIRKTFSKFLSFRPPKGNLVFLRELVNVFVISSASKDSKILFDWIIRNLTLVFYRKHRQFLGFLKKALLHVFPKLRREFKIRGFLLTFRGKIGQVGSVRKKAVFLRRGTQSFSNLNLKISSSTGAVTTGTGSIGVTVSLFY